MHVKRSKHLSLRTQIRRLQIGSTILFFLFLCLAGMFVYGIYLFTVKGPDPYYLENQTEPVMCHCYFWGCYCCPEDIDRVLVYDLNTNVTNVAIYEDCQKTEYLPAYRGKESVDDLSCRELVDYLENGRRCSGTFKTRCIYPYIWNEKAVLEEQIMVKNCPVS